jgi:hypothetical protein
MSDAYLQDYRREGVFYRLNLDKGTVSGMVGDPEMISGYAAYVRRGVLRKRSTFVACFLERDDLNMVIGSHRYNLTRDPLLEVAVQKRKPFSLHKVFRVLMNGEVVDSLRYVSITSSEEQWPDGFVDICRYIAKLPRHDTESLREELSRAGN